MAYHTMMTKVLPLPGIPSTLVGGIWPEVWPEDQARGGKRTKTFR